VTSAQSAAAGGTVYGISLKERTFFTPERLAQEKIQRVGSPRGQLVMASCRSGAYLADQVAARYRELLDAEGSQSDVTYIKDVDFRFSDSETCVRLDTHVGGHDVFLFQALLDPTADRQVDENYAAFHIAARTFLEHGANHVTGVLPYLAYARQDKPTRFEREPTTAKLMADLSTTAGMDRLITWHPHRNQVPGFYGSIPVHTLEAVSLFVEAFERFRGRDDVIAVAPDVGASKFVTYFGRALNVNSAVASKYRLRPGEAVISEIIGDFSGKKVAIVLDDMVSSGSTVDACVRQLVKHKGIQEVYLGVSHNLCSERAFDRLSKLHSDYQLRQVVVTNTIPQTEAFRALSFLLERDLSDLLARVINRIHYDRSVSELFTQPKSRMTV
jgi:ribose-phosphate pyrophosphokinase